MSKGERYHLDVFSYLVFFIFLLITFGTSGINKYFGIVIFLVGLLVWLLGLFALKDSFQIKAEAKKLITSNIYSKIRHPIYVGSFIADLGFLVYTVGTILFWFLLAYTILFLIIQYFRIVKEEKILLKKFGKKYLVYREKTWI